ncbi:MAG: TylF/MycF family methyltransferase [Treponema sp.]|jgi:O-methyltransferase|nr:TylF/MycF family methyltransferase [Treponema sp.]
MVSFLIVLEEKNGKSYFEIKKKSINSILRKYGQISCGLMVALDKERQKFVFEEEYIRASSLELIAHEIYDKNIQGSVTELGVYRGQFARIINIAFPDRKLFLFDTFEGFDKRDVKIELENNYSTGAQDFSETTVALVLSRMDYKQNCIITKDIAEQKRR